jgi:hypothetical protein
MLFGSGKGQTGNDAEIWSQDSQIREQLPKHRKQDALKTVGDVTGDQTSTKQASPAFFLDDLFRRVDCDNPLQVSGLDMANIDLKR